MKLRSPLRGVMRSALAGATAQRASGAKPSDVDATDWVARVQANGGTVSAATQAAVTAFASAAKANGYWSKFVRLNLMCGNQLAAMVVPLVKALDPAVDGTGGNSEAKSWIQSSQNSHCVPRIATAS